MKLSVLLPIRVNKTSFGTIEPGNLADIVITAADPLAHIRSLKKRENIKVVMQGGQGAEGYSVEFTSMLLTISMRWQLCQLRLQWASLYSHDLRSHEQ